MKACSCGRALVSGFCAGCGSDRDACACAKSPAAGPNLPDDFWTATPTLATVRAFARARMIPCDVMLGRVLGEVAAHVSPMTKLPPTVGARSGLNLFVAYVGPSGAGKSVAEAATADLFHVIGGGEVTRHGIGTGEGLIALYRTEKGDEVADSAVVSVDEIETLDRIGERKGATIWPELRKAWSGSQLGTRNRSKDTSVTVPAGTYRLVVHLGVQPLKALGLLESEGGTTQRVLWLSALDPGVDPDAEWDGQPITWRPPIHDGDLVVADNVVKSIRADRAADVAEGRSIGHANLLRLRVAALLSALHVTADRWNPAPKPGDVTDEWWELAGMVTATSDSVAASIHKAQSQSRRDKAVASALHRAEVEDVVAEDREAKARRQAAEAITRYLRARPDTPQSAREIRKGLTMRHRPHADAVLATLLIAGHLQAVPEYRDNGRRITCYQLRP